MNTSLTELSKTVKTKMSYTKGMIKRPANGAIPFDYLVPSGYYEEQWDWDAFFMGVGLASEIPSEAIYLKNWSLNYIINADNEGKVAGCVTPAGPDPRLKQIKPLIAQGTYLGARFLKDYEWVRPYYNKLKTIVGYREKNSWNEKYDLGVWFDSMESGADNNVAALDYPDNTVVAADFNAFMYREYLALSLLAKELEITEDEKIYKEKAEKLKTNLNKYLWNDEDKIYYNLDSRNGEHIKRISYSCFVPLWAELATQEQAKTTIEKYMLNTEHLMTQYGMRTLSKQDHDYNNVNMIKPHSNWQGPIWPIANHIYMQGLINYGFQHEALELAEKVSNLVLADIDKTGGMHENYDAETGKPLAAPFFVSWNVLVINMIEEAQTMKNPFKI